MNPFEKIKEKLLKLIDISYFKTVDGTPYAGTRNLAYHKVLEIVEQVEKEYNNGWIPCSERLPGAKEKRFGNKQKRTGVLVTLRNGVVKEMLYEFETKEFWDEGSENPIGYWKEDVTDSDLDVIAWQPLPVPFKEGEQ